MMELGFKSSQTSEYTGNLFGTFPGAYSKNPALKNTIYTDLFPDKVTFLGTED